MSNTKTFGHIVREFGGRHGISEIVIARRLADASQYYAGLADVVPQSVREAEEADRDAFPALQFPALIVSFGGRFSKRFIYLTPYLHNGKPCLDLRIDTSVHLGERLVIEDRGGVPGESWGLLFSADRHAGKQVPVDKLFRFPKAA